MVQMYRDAGLTVNRGDYFMQLLLGPDGAGCQGGAADLGQVILPPVVNS